MVYRDYRYQAINGLPENWIGPYTGTIKEQNNAVIAAGVTQYGAERVLTFPLPNVTAICLDQAYSTWIGSQHFLKGESLLEIPNTHTSGKTLTLTKDSTFFDLIQMKMTAIVFAYTALESFANESIPDKFVFRRKRDDKKCIEEYTKVQTEVLSLDMKLHEVLPIIFNLRSPKGSSIWNRYIFLKNLRNRIIHMKSKDRQSAIFGEENIWNDMLNQSCPNLAIEAKEIIGYYLNNLEEKDRPQWYKEFPWEK